MMSSLDRKSMFLVMASVVDAALCVGAVLGISIVCFLGTQAWREVWFRRSSFAYSVSAFFVIGLGGWLLIRHRDLSLRTEAMFFRGFAVLVLPLLLVGVSAYLAAPVVSMAVTVDLRVQLLVHVLFPLSAIWLSLRLRNTHVMSSWLLAAFSLIALVAFAKAFAVHHV